MAVIPHPNTNLTTFEMMAIVGFRTELNETHAAGAFTVLTHR